MNARPRTHGSQNGVREIGLDVLLAVLVHAGFILLLVLGTLDWHFDRPRARPALNLDVRVVDSSAVQLNQDRRRAEQEAARRRDQERRRREQELAAQREREQRQAEQRRQQGQERQRALEQQRQREQETARQREQQRQAEAERQRQAQEEARRRAAEQQRQRETDLARQREQERQQQLEALRRQREAAEREAQAEQERVAREAEQRRQREEQERLAREQAAREAAEAQAAAAAAQASLREQYAEAIRVVVTNNWLRPATARSGLRCRINVVQIPGGEVIDANVTGPCNGDSATQRSILNAVRRAGDLPYRGFESVFEREITFTFTYDE